MKSRIEKLMTVKSLVTLGIVMVYCYLAITEKIDLKGFESIVLMIMAFYFGTQVTKND
ncbi:MAG TPA: hypothetical protein VLS94_09005 [Fusibacter sp.]|nr:hypothetical protein [Fusibacter sp.]